MRKTNQRVFNLVIVVLYLIGCQGGDHEGHEHGHGEETHVEVPKGPHGGKVFEQDGFSIEVTIYEPGIPPQSRVYVYEDEEPIDPAPVTLVTELHRIDRIDTIRYKKQDDYLLGDMTIEEPHSFDVKLKATYKGKDYSWAYSSYEGRTTLSDDAIKSTGIKLEKAGPALIATSVTLNGRVVPDKLKFTKLMARFPGVVKEIRKLPGAKVEKGEVVATIEANESLKTYDITAPRSGEILDLNASVGENVAGEDPVLTVGDLSSVWVELSVPKSDFTKLHVGQRALVADYQGKNIYLSATADGDTQTRLARVEIPNPDRALIPELFVEAEIIIKERQVSVAVKAEALQTFRDWDVVFKKVGQNFEIAILELGERDGDWIEVISGLAPGAEYVTENSFVVKADVMKSGATHDH